MILENIQTGVRVVRCLDVDSREADINLNIEKPFLAGFENMAGAMKARERRREIIERFAASFVDYLNDRDGWNGERRRALIEDLEAPHAR
jgi:hypothetical protein